MSIDPVQIANLTISNLVSGKLKTVIEDAIKGSIPEGAVDHLKEQSKILRDIADHTQPDMDLDLREAFQLPVYSTTLYWQVPPWKRGHWSMLIGQATTLYIYTERVGLVQRPVDPSKGLWYQMDLPAGTQLSCSSANTNVMVRWCNEPIGTSI